MKYLFFVVITVASLVAMLSCGPSEQKVAGIVKEFLPNGGINGAPKIIFTDKREFTINRMPDAQIDSGSEIAIYYQARVDNYIAPDSIVVVKLAPIKSDDELSADVSAFDSTELIDTTVLRPGDYDAICALITSKGTMVSESDCQYVYIDKRGNRHAMITIRRTNNKPDKSATIMQISVWVNGSVNHISGKKFFGYIINRKGIRFSTNSGKTEIRSALKDLVLSIKRK